MSQVADTSDILRGIRRAGRVIVRAPSLFIVLGVLLLGGGFLVGQLLYSSQLGVAQQHIEQLRDQVAQLESNAGIKPKADAIDTTNTQLESSEPSPVDQPISRLKFERSITKKPNPLPDGRYSLNVVLVNPINLEAPIAEIRNVSPYTIDMFVRTFNVAIELFDVSTNEFGPFKLPPGASQRITRKEPIDLSVLNPDAYIQIEVKINYGVSPNDERANALVERFVCDSDARRKLTCVKNFSYDWISDKVMPNVAKKKSSSR